MPCSREEGQPPGEGSTRVAPEAILIRLKCSAQSPLGPSRTNKVLFERTLFVAAVRRSLLCLDSPQVKFSAERVASGRPRLRGSQRQKPRKNKSAGSEGMPCSREEGQPPGDGSTRVAPEANLIRLKCSAQSPSGLPVQIKFCLSVLSLWPPSAGVCFVWMARR